MSNELKISYSSFTKKLMENMKEINYFEIKDCNNVTEINPLIDQSLLPVYFLDEIGALRSIGIDKKLYYVFLKEEDYLFEVPSELVYLSNDKNDFITTPKGYVITIFLSEITKETIESNTRLRNRLNDMLI